MPTIHSALMLPFLGGLLQTSGWLLIGIICGAWLASGFGGEVIRQGGIRNLLIGVIISGLIGALLGIAPIAIALWLAFLSRVGLRRHSDGIRPYVVRPDRLAGKKRASFLNHFVNADSDKADIDTEGDEG